MRARIIVEVDTDQVPGWGYDPEDYANHIRNHLNQTIPHYNPEVRLLDENEYIGGPESKEQQIARAKSMKTAGYSNVEIANALGIRENTVRILLTK